MITVRELLFFLNLPSYTHIVVKVFRKGKGMFGLGGGDPETIAKRYYDLYVSRTYILEDKFYIVVKEF